MYIDNRVPIPFAMPFVVLLMVRLLWWIAGAPWSEPGIAAAMSVLSGAAVGAIVAVIMFDEGATIGGFYIGRKGGEK